MNTIVWFRVWFLSITPYGLLLAMSVPAVYLVTMRMRRYFRALRNFSVLGCMALAVPCALAGSRLYHWIFSFNAYSFWEALAMWRGGHSLCGALLGFCLGVWLYCRPRKLRALDALDCFSPAVALFVAIERFAEHFTDQGVGKVVDTEFLQRGIFTMTDANNGFARHAVYRMELVSALLALFFVIVFFRKSLLRRFRLRGEAFRLALLSLAAPQVVWESLRDDGVLMPFEYVRITQVASMLCVLALGLFYLIKWLNTGAPMGRVGLQTAVLLLCCGLAVRQEFAVDTNQNMEFNYLIMAAAMAGMSVATLKARKAWTLWNMRRARSAPRR